MPPRYAYWTILIDNAPTAFRAREQSELLPTLQQLRRTNKEVALKWFSHGRVWDSPEAATQRPPAGPPDERRGKEWRPGGQHKDPRARFTKPPKSKGQSDRPFRPKSDRPAAPWTPKPTGDSARGPAKPWQRERGGQTDKPRDERAAGAMSSPGRRPWEGRPKGAEGRPEGGKRPWQDRPKGTAEAPGAKRPWQNRPAGGGAGETRRPWEDRPKGPQGAPGAKRPWQNRPASGGAGETRRPWEDRPQSPPKGAPAENRRPWDDRPKSSGAGGGGKRPWQNRPAGVSGGNRRPWQDRSKGAQICGKARTTKPTGRGEPSRTDDAPRRKPKEPGDD